MKNITNYEVKSSDISIIELFTTLNYNHFHCYGPETCNENINSKIICDTLFSYKRFLSSLLNTNTEFLTFRDFISGKINNQKKHILIRHDVDSDLPGALLQAKIETELGVKSSYYFLHSSQYYGKVKNKVFYRNDCIINVFHEIQSLGHEVGIHSDPLSFYKDHKIDGKQAFITELKWLRDNGITVDGSLSHNSAAYYGAENYEIFKNRYRHTKKNEKHDDFVQINDINIPLRDMDEKQLGLKYEPHLDIPGDWNPNSYEYGATRFQDRWRWIKYSKELKLNNQEKNEHPFITHSALIEDINSLADDSLVQLVVHPCYFGLRYSETDSPILFRNDYKTDVNKFLGWETYIPDRIHCFSDFNSYQAISHANQLGLLDYTLPSKKRNNEKRILLLGGENIDASKINVPSQNHIITEKILNQQNSDNHYIIRKLAYPKMGISRLWSWFLKIKDIYKPDIVLLEINQNSIIDNIPYYWSRTTGYSMNYPPGDYLIFDDEKQMFMLKEKSAQWRLHSNKPLKIESVFDKHNFFYILNKQNINDFIKMLSYIINELVRYRIKIGFYIQNNMILKSPIIKRIITINENVLIFNSLIKIK